MASFVMFLKESHAKKLLLQPQKVIMVIDERDRDISSDKIHK